MKTYRPLPKALTIKNSQIEGLGVFSTHEIPEGVIFLAHPTHYYEQDKCRRINFGGFINHSADPNCKLVEDKVKSEAYLATVRPIKDDEEITVDYAVTKCGSYYTEFTKDKEYLKGVIFDPSTIIKADIQTFEPQTCSEEDEYETDVVLVSNRHQALDYMEIGWEIEKIKPIENSDFIELYIKRKKR